MDPVMARQMEEKLQQEVNKLKMFAEQLNKLMGPRAKNMSQKNENEMVKAELDQLEDDATLYKLVGPVMIKQDLDDAKSNVENRLKYFNSELERLDKTQKDLEEKQEKQRTVLMELQEVVRRTQQAMVQAAMQEQKQG